jgi:hypothetical protein
MPRLREVDVGGVYINMVVKSGSNALHRIASAFYDTAATEAGINLPTFQGQTVQAGVPIIMTPDTAVNLGGPFITAGGLSAPTVGMTSRKACCRYEGRTAALSPTPITTSSAADLSPVR